MPLWVPPWVVLRGAPPGAPWGTAKSEKRRGTGAKTDGRTLTVNGRAQTL